MAPNSPLPPPRSVGWVVPGACPGTQGQHGSWSLYLSPVSSCPCALGRATENGAHSQVLIEYLLCADYWAADTVVGKTDPRSAYMELTVWWD